jgi:hypothetical protein
MMSCIRHQKVANTIEKYGLQDKLFWRRDWSILAKFKEGKQYAHAVRLVVLASNRIKFQPLEAQKQAIA